MLLPYDEGGKLNELYALGAPIEKREDTSDGVLIVARLPRKEIRRWRDGLIPDIDEAVASPQRLTSDPVVAQRLFDLVPAVPTPVWGRDQLHAGEMWNSNSVTSWLIARSGLDVGSAQLPPGGRAPGWDAGIFGAALEVGARFESHPDGGGPDAKFARLLTLRRKESSRG